jgi:GNAT superfamily N-acetyltransferase
MAQYSDMWEVADGLAEPVDDQLQAALADPDTHVYLGEIDGVPFGFTLARVESLLPQADGRRIGSFRLVFVDHDAREVGLGEALRDTAMEDLKALGITRFDAHVLPGHRLVKNFFESGGFSARSIVMHHDVERER